MPEEFQENDHPDSGGGSARSSIWNT